MTSSFLLGFNYDKIKTLRLANIGILLMGSGNKYLAHISFDIIWKHLETMQYSCKRTHAQAKERKDWWSAAFQHPAEAHSQTIWSTNMSDLQHSTSNAHIWCSSVKTGSPAGSNMVIPAEPVLAVRFGKSSGVAKQICGTHHRWIRWLIFFSAISRRLHSISKDVLLENRTVIGGKSMDFHHFTTRFSASRPCPASGTKRPR